VKQQAYLRRVLKLYACNMLKARARHKPKTEVDLFVSKAKALVREAGRS
jgi:hypothetical protein